MASRSLIRSYYQLTKPGIIYGNLFMALGGYLFASQWHNNYPHLLGMLIGLGLIIACGCSLNNVIDRELDAVMERTKKRAIVTGNISITQAVSFGLILGILGTVILAVSTNHLAVLVALFGLIAYLAFYGYAKRKTVYGTLVGSIAGAIPPLVGYVSVTNVIDLSGVIIFMILVCWQISHFYAISLFRKQDYKAANIPIWPLVKGDKSTQLQIFGFMVLFCLFGLSLFLIGDCGFIYCLVILGVSAYWFISALNTLKTKSVAAWGKQVFHSSLIVLVLTAAALAIGPIAP